MKLVEASGILESLLDLFEKNIGKSSPSTLQFGIKLGNILWDNNQFITAYNLPIVFIRFVIKTFGPKFRITIKYRILLAKCMMRMRRSSEALSLLTTIHKKLDLTKIN